jgi:hypothetical protein
MDGRPGRDALSLTRESMNRRARRRLLRQQERAMKSASATASVNGNGSPHPVFNGSHAKALAAKIMEIDRTPDIKVADDGTIDVSCHGRRVDVEPTPEPETGRTFRDFVLAIESKVREITNSRDNTFYSMGSIYRWMLLQTRDARLPIFRVERRLDPPVDGQEWTKSRNVRLTPEMTDFTAEQGKKTGVFVRALEAVLQDWGGPPKLTQEGFDFDNDPPPDVQEDMRAIADTLAENERLKAENAKFTAGDNRNGGECERCNAELRGDEAVVCNECVIDQLKKDITRLKAENERLSKLAEDYSRAASVAEERLSKSESNRVQLSERLRKAQGVMAAACCNLGNLVPDDLMSKYKARYEFEVAKRNGQHQASA